MFRFQIQLEQNEAAALSALAEAERRDVRQQAEVLLVNALKQLGALRPQARHAQPSDGGR
jgi:hypothetical protein